ncbi:MAG TPA: glycosyltransferase family 39 protein [Aquihabitans sp.]|jgi:hypothetical protein|nr:glycosyltransferase family 39 protein [Aquihabitans sp.]
MTDVQAPPAAPTLTTLRREPAVEVPTRAGWAVRPLVTYGLSRLLLLAVAVVMAQWAQARGTDPGAGPWPSLPGDLPGVADVLGRWDGAWYTDLARHGYPGAGDLPSDQRHLAFFPLFPGLVRIVASLTPLTTVGAGIVVSVLAGALAVVLVWRVVADLAGDEAADRAAAVLSFFPGSVVLSMAYAEGLLVAGAAGTMLALQRRRWVLAGAIAAITTLSRPNALAVGAMCAVAAAAAIAERRDWRSLAAPLLAPVGVLGFFGYLAVLTGWPLAWFRGQRDGWQDSPALLGAPFEHLEEIWERDIFGLRSTQLNPLVGVLGLAFVAFAGYLLVRWRPPVIVFTYTAVSIGMALASQMVGARPRMILAAFPLVVVLGVRYTGRAHTAIVAVSAVASCLTAGLLFGSLAMTP